MDLDQIASLATLSWHSVTRPLNAVDIALMTTATVGAAAMGASLLPPLFRTITPEVRDGGLGDRLPFQTTLSDGRTMITPSGFASLMVEVKGIDTHGGTLAQREQARAVRRQAFAAVLASGTDLRVLTQRRPLPAPWVSAAAPGPTVQPEGRLVAESDAGPLYRKRLIETWDAAQLQLMETAHLVILTRQASGNTPAALAEAGRALAQSAVALSDILSHAGYGVTVPRLGKPGRPSPLLSRWAGIVHPKAPASIPAVEPPFGPALVAGPIRFDHATGRIEASSEDGRLVGQVLIISRLPASTEDLHGQRLAALPVQMTILHQASPISRQQAIARIEYKRRRALGAVIPVEGHGELEQSVAMLQNEASTAQMLQYSLTVIVWAEDEEALRHTLRTVQGTLADLGMVVQVASDLAITQYWNQFPGFEDNRIRTRLIESVTLTDLAVLETPMSGLDRTDWGPGAVAQFQTVMRTSFSFTFHDAPGEEEPGHTVVFGPTGGGKTVMMAMMLANALERFPRLRVAAFDRELGLFVPTIALGGRYVQFIPDGAEADSANGVIQRAKLEPFSRDLDGEREAHLRGLLRLMGQDTSPEFDELIDRVLRSLKRQPVPQHRRLSVWFDQLVAREEPVRNALARFLPGGAYGHVIASDPMGADALRMGDRFVSIDMGGVADDEILSPIVVKDIGFELTRVARQEGAPSLMVLDEAMALLRNPMFQGEALQWLDMMRKLRASLVFMFQRPGQLRQIGQSAVEAMRTQTVTQIFLRDPSAEWADYAEWGLSPREFDFIRNADPTYRRLERAILVRQPRRGVSVVLDVDLAPLGELLSLLRSGSNVTARVRRLASGAELDWRPLYFDELRRTRS